MTRKHVVIDENEYPNNTEIFTELANLIQCKVHSDHEVQFKCLVQNAFICSVCTITIHKRCKDILNIDNLNSGNSSEWGTNISKLTSLKESLNAVIASKLAEAERLDTNISSIDSTIPALRDAIEDMVKFLQYDLLLKYHDRAELEKIELSSHIVQCLAAINALSTANHFAETLLQYNLAEEHIVYVERLRDKVEDIKLCLKKLTAVHNDDASRLIKDNMLVLKTTILGWMNKLCNLEFGKESQDTDFKQQVAASSMGLDTDTQEQAASIDTDTDHENQTGIDRSKPTLKTTKAGEECVSVFRLSECTIHKLTEVDVSVPGGHHNVCSHTGCILLQNGSIIFLDQTNKTVKMVDSKLRYKCHVTLKNEPVDVLKIKTDTVCVATSCVISVFLFSRNKLQKLNDFLFKDIHILLSICVYGNNLAILQKYKHDNTRDFIQIRTTGNKIVRDITSFTDTSSKPIRLDKPNFIRSTSARDFVICDGSNLTKVDRHGKCITKFKQSRLKSATYFSFNPQEEIFLCDGIGGNIFLIPANLSSKARVLIRGIDSPAAIAFDDVKKQLIICCLHNSNVLIYQLSWKRFSYAFTVKHLKRIVPKEVGNFYAIHMHLIIACA